MNLEEINVQIADYISNEIIKLPNRVLDPNEALISTGLIDSFHLVDLALFVEDQLGVHIDDSELNAQTFDSLSQLIALIQSRLS